MSDMRLLLFGILLLTGCDVAVYPYHIENLSRACAGKGGWASLTTSVGELVGRCANGTYVGWSVIAEIDDVAPPPK